MSGLRKRQFQDVEEVSIHGSTGLIQRLEFYDSQFGLVCSGPPVAAICCIGLSIDS